MPPSVLFVCLGNICRSPMAEAVFRKLIKDIPSSDKWRIGSRAIGPYHVGHTADKRTISVLKSNDYDVNHTVTQIRQIDFFRHWFILGMDNENLAHLRRLAPKNSTAKIELLGKYDPTGKLIIKDPFFKNEQYFQKTLDHCVRACKGFLEVFQKKVEETVEAKLNS